MTDLGIASPLPLILEEKEAREVLLLSFTLDLGFWERVALSAARSLGALVTVVGDARFVSADPRAVRGAGRSYLDGRALCRSGAAFHPKLVVILGKERATVAIGSGNATLAGWGDNSELWTVLRAAEGHRQDALTSLASWLRTLPQFVAFSRGVQNAFVRVADGLDGIKGAVERGPTVLTNTTQPILDQLPAGPVDRLSVSAPFFDEGVQGLRELVGKLRPREVQVAIQTGLTSIKGSSLNRLLEEHHGRAFTATESRYLHGKLFEWEVGGEIFAVTGSPNASSSALLRSTASGGNCELALLASVPTSIFPEVGERIPSNVLAGLMHQRQAQRLSGVVLLGAERVEAGVRLSFASPLADAVWMEVAESTDVWLRRDEIPTGEHEVILPYDLAPGVAVRVIEGEDPSNVVFVADPARVLRRLLEHAGRVRTDESGVFQDVRLAEGFLQDLMELKRFLPADGRGIGRKDSSAERDTRFTFQSWDEYLDFVDGRIGPAMTRFSLGLPVLPGEVGDWTGDPEVEGGSPDGADDGNGDEEVALPDFRDRSEAEQKRYRTWSQKLATAMTSLAPLGRVIALRLLLRGVAGQLWNSPDEWIPLLSTAVRSAVAGAEPMTDNEREAVASASAAMISVLHAHVRHHVARGPLEIAYQAAESQALALLPFRSVALVEEFGSELSSGLGGCVRRDAVEGLAEQILHGDPIEDAIRELANQGIEAERVGRIIKVFRSSVDPRKLAFRTLAFAERAAPVAAAVPAQDGGWAFVAWDPPRLLVLRKMARQPSWLDPQDGCMVLFPFTGEFRGVEP